VRAAPEIIPFTTEHLDAAAEILAARQRRLRTVRPELPEAFTRSPACRPLIAGILEKPGSHGVLALRGDEPLGYLLGYPRTEPIWGRACWSPDEGSALADGVDPEVMRDLYSAWSEHFVRTGHFLHYAHAPADDPELMAAWSRTGFGQMQAYAARDVTLEPSQAAGFAVRRAKPEDIDLVDSLLPLIALAVMRPPAYAITLPEGFTGYRESWLEELADPTARHYLAEEGGMALGMASFYDTEPGPMVPDGAWEMSVAMTAPDQRGRGVVRALVAAAFAEARDAGVSHCIADWRTAALPTHRSWTALGWRPTHYRLHRHIDERVAWAAPR
jgi:GNAT superfamily N-acetyltransferase